MKSECEKVSVLCFILTIVSVISTPEWSHLPNYKQSNMSGQYQNISMRQMVNAIRRRQRTNPVEVDEITQRHMDERRADEILQKFLDELRAEMDNNVFLSPTLKQILMRLIYSESCYNNEGTSEKEEIQISTLYGEIVEAES